MTRLHKIYLIIIAVCGVPFAGLGLFLAIPATLDFSSAVILLLTPGLLVLWDIVLLIRGNRIKKLKAYLIAFYIITAIISIMASLMTFDRDGTKGFIFNPIIAIPVAIFFIVPIVALIKEKQEKITEQIGGM